jgi:hypothetical protein
VVSAAKPAPGLVFYPKSHRYKLDGAWVPGVTTILNVLDKPGLRKWAASSVAEYVADHRDAVEHLYDAGRGPMVAMLKETPWQQRDDAADRGTTFHAYAEQIATGAEVDVPEAFVPMVEQSLDFMDRWSIDPVLIEVACASREHRYAGKLDLVAKYRHPVTGERGIGIFDWKSGKRIYAACAFQLAGYGMAEFHGERGDEHSMAELGITASFGVHIRADGHDVHPLPYGPEIHAEFVTIRKAFDINKRAEGDWKVPGSGYVGRSVQPTTESESAA